MEVESKQTRVCSKCGEEKPWIYSHSTMQQNFARRIHKDEAGRQWNSGTCPTCFSAQVSECRRKKKARDLLASCEEE